MFKQKSVCSILVIYQSSSLICVTLNYVSQHLFKRVRKLETRLVWIFSSHMTFNFLISFTFDSQFSVKGSTGDVAFLLVAGIVFVGQQNPAVFGKTSFLSVLTVPSGAFVVLLGSICGSVSVLKCPGFWSSERAWQGACVRICSGEKCPVKFTLWCGTKLEVQVSSSTACLNLQSAQLTTVKTIKLSSREPELGLTIIHGKIPQCLWTL